MLRGTVETVGQVTQTDRRTEWTDGQTEPCLPQSVDGEALKALDKPQNTKQYKMLQNSNTLKKMKNKYEIKYTEKKNKFLNQELASYIFFS